MNSNKWYTWAGSESSVVVISEQDLLKAIDYGNFEPVDNWFINNFMGHLRRVVDFRTHFAIDLKQIRNRVIHGQPFTILTVESEKYGFGITKQQAEYAFDLINF